MTEKKPFVENKALRAIVNAHKGLSMHITKDKGSGNTRHRITRDDYKHGALWVEIRDEGKAKEFYFVWADGDVGVFLNRKAVAYYGEQHHVNKGAKVWRWDNTVAMDRITKLCGFLKGGFISRTGDLK